MLAVSGYEPCVLGDGVLNGDAPFLLQLAPKVGEEYEGVREGQAVIVGAR